MDMSCLREEFPYLLAIPEEDYHRAAREGEFIGSHQLADFRTCPLLFHKKATGEIERADSAAFAFGRALHKLVLEGRMAFNEEYVVNAGPVNPKTGEPFGKLTKAYREWAASQNAEIVSPEDYEIMRKIAEAVHAHPEAQKLLESGFPECTIRTASCGQNIQARMDWFNPYFENNRRVIVDLKTCDNLDNFERDARRFGYPQQLEFYHHALFCAEEECGLSEHRLPTDLYIIGVEKREPYRVGVWKLTDDLVMSASCENQRAMARLKRCREADEWPTDYEGLRVLGVE